MTFSTNTQTLMKKKQDYFYIIHSEEKMFIQISIRIYMSVFQTHQDSGLKRIII